MIESDLIYSVCLGNISSVDLEFILKVFEKKSNKDKIIIFTNLAARGELERALKVAESIKNPEMRKKIKEQMRDLKRG